jgi:ADP-heptose:LPS heptosyltransferase
MTPPSYRDRWDAIRKDTVNPDQLFRLSREIANSFLDYYLKDCRYEEDYIDLLCEMTTFSSDPEMNSPGTHALFGTIVESLCDDFEELQTETYNRVMAQVISFCRRIPAGNELDIRLQEFGLNTREELIRRTGKIRTSTAPLKQGQSLKKILILSRVTIGADIAITSVIIQRLHSLFPEAEIILMGGSKLEEVYGANPILRLREVPYERKGGLLDRLASWHTVLEIIEDETGEFRQEEVVLIDPDSRFSQLGVLPLVSSDRYYFFDSRSDSALNRTMSMPELTNDWISRLTGNKSFSYPRLWIPERYRQKAASLCQSLRAGGAEKIIAVNFGVGGNARKRVNRRLEEKLLLALLKEPDTLILLDKGFGKEETGYINSLIDDIQNQGHNTAHMNVTSEERCSVSHGVVGITSSIGEMAALIQHCNEFLGYDSACQHIAAAVQIPCITIFAGSNNMRFIRRWSAHGPKPCDIVHVDTLTDRSMIDMDDIINRVMHLRQLRNLT